MYCGKITVERTHNTGPTRSTLGLPLAKTTYVSGHSNTVAVSRCTLSRDADCDAAVQYKPAMYVGKRKKKHFWNRPAIRAVIIDDYIKNKGRPIVH